jgi:DNA-directed RNA polymerase subunit N (RpoN/RPB10)
MSTSARRVARARRTSRITVNSIRADVSGATDRNVAHTRKALYELKRVLRSELNQRCQENDGAQEAAKQVYILGLIKNHMDGLGATDRLHHCQDLAAWLWECCGNEYNHIALGVFIEVQAQLLNLRPAGHPDRARSCGNLAISLWKRYNQTGDTELLDKAIKLEEEALDLRPAGHPDRALSCANLAISLRTRYRQTGDTALLDKAIKLEEEALHLCPVGHPDRARSCGNLASSLMIRYRQTGDTALLDKTIELEEEALDLHPAGHPGRAVACGNLAVSLETRYHQTGDTTLLDQAIKLEEEALALRPVGHPDRALSCAKLASSLWARYNQTKDTTLLDTTIKLEEEALDLRPAGHPNRALSCANLAASLWTRYHQTGDTALLDKAIKLEEEALHLCPVGHPDRATSCVHLGNSLWTRYTQTRDTTLLDKAIELNHQALSLSTSSDPARWRYSLNLARLGQITSSDLNWQVILGHLYQVFNASSYDSINALLDHAVKRLLDIKATSMSLQHQQQLLALHVRAVHIVAVAANLAVETSTRLQHTLYGVALGPATLSLARSLNELPAGLQSLERARGVIWTHMLHLRDPQLDRVPNELAAQLRGLLHMSSKGVQHGSSMPRGRSSEYSQRNQLQDVIRQIRSLPGLSDFMRGPDVNTLLSVGAESPVVVLVAGPRECCALLITSGARLEHVAMPEVTLHMLRDLTFDSLASRKRGTPTGLDSLDRGMKVTKGASPAHSRLAKLWRAVVKPVLEKLSIPVCTYHFNTSQPG